MNEQVERGSIVVAVDGSEHAERAAEWAAEQALAEHRPLVVVAVDSHPSTVAEDAAAALRDAHSDLRVHALTLAGEPRQVLLDLSAHAHLLVAGSRGRGPLKSAFLGSVSAALSKGSRCPLVVCRPRAEGPSERGVLVGADGTPESVPVIEFAYRQAALRNQPLTVLHCFWDAVAAVAQYRAARGEVVEEPELDDLRAIVSESVAGLAEQYPDVPVTISLQHGLVDEALSPRYDGWDLIVVGRHPMTPTTQLSRVLTGSVATTVLERAHTTVAVVPQAPRSA